MKTKYQCVAKTLCLWAVMMSVMSCGDFLEEKSQDLFIPKTVDDFKEFVAGEGLNQGSNNKVALAEYLDILTDDVTEMVNVRRKETLDSREPIWGYYTWQVDPEVDFNNKVQPDRLWEVSYHRILIANIVLDKLSSMVGTDEKKKDLEAEVRFLRAWSYFMLVNTYAHPYESAEQAQTTAGVPINASVSVENKRYARATLAEVYRLIQADLVKAAQLYQESRVPTSIYRPNLDVTRLLLSRVMLYTRQYQSTVDWASKLIDNSRVKLYDISRYDNKQKIRFFDLSNNEILFTYGAVETSRLDNYITASRATKGSFMVDTKLLQMYQAKDKRRAMFFNVATGTTVKPFKFYKSGSKGVFNGVYHLSEAYLNIAEAYVELGQKDQAEKMLNTLRAHRIEDYIASSFATLDDVRTAVRNERRMELCFEGHRWFDLRRWGRPALKHTYSSSDDASQKQTYELKENDPRYTLPVPRAEREINYNLK